MNYFVGSLYGNYEGYLTIKEKLKLKKNDTLWIMGDVFDGNDANPEHCVQIVQDIAESPNINLILGDHEYGHIMRYVMLTKKDGYEAWKNYLLSMDISGEALVWFFENAMDPIEQDEVFNYLIAQCEVTRLIQIGGNYFYLVHGFPCMYETLTEWQVAVTSSNIQPGNYLKPILTDESLNEQEKQMLGKLKKNNTFVICSHQNIHEFTTSGNIYHKNGIFLLGEDIPNEQVPVLGIDAAGYFLNNIVYI